MSQPIYMDHNASTPVATEVFRAMRPYLETHFGNPSCGHVYGTKAAAAVADSRKKVAELLGCDPEEIIFTSGGTESNNIAVVGTATARADRSAILTSRIEHPAINSPCAHLETTGRTIIKLPVDSVGIVDPAAFESHMNENTALVSLMHANNETGSIQPVRDVADAARRFDIAVHTDAAQSVGKVWTRVDELDVDLLTIAGHKLYAPKGVGALYIRNGTNITPVLFGAEHERGLRPGTENVASIVGLGAACELANQTLSLPTYPIQELRDELHSRLQSAVPDLKLNGHPLKRLPNTLNVSFPGVRSSEMLARADQVAASTGAACHEGGEELPSSVLVEMGIDRDTALGAVRLSLGRDTTAKDIESAAASLIEAYRSLVPLQLYSDG